MGKVVVTKDKVIHIVHSIAEFLCKLSLENITFVIIVLTILMAERVGRVLVGSVSKYVISYKAFSLPPKLQTSLLAIQHWRTKCRLKANRSKSMHVTFTTRRATCPWVHIYNEQLPLEEELKYLGLYLDRLLTWHKHIFAKRKHRFITLSKMYWLLGRKSKFSLSNKLLVILKSVWTYGIQLWGSASISNIEMLERSQGKVLRMITDAPWYVPNMVL
jgi:hypothetical protein